MGDAIEEAVERVVAAMRENLGEPLTVDDMARVAMFSKFHFTRIFQRVTGLSPRRYLSALRLQQAKQLLVTTSMSVADISVRVGYNSVGTFSSRFTRSVGLSPTAYRRRGGFNNVIATDTTSFGNGVISGRAWTRPVTEPQLVFVGLFPTRIAEGRPARFALLNGPGQYTFERVPEGTWFVLSQSVTSSAQSAVHRPFAGEHALAVATYGPIKVEADTVIRTADLRHRPMRSVDPPVLLALLDVNQVAVAAAEPMEHQPAA